MKRSWLLVPFALAGCITAVDKPIDLGALCAGDLRSSTPVDMPAAQAKCAAAKGLSGDNLLCVDFDKVTQLTDPALGGWNFNANMAGCWQISGGFLSVANFATFVGNCGLTLLPLDLKQPAYQKYQQVTLTLLHRVDMSDIDQTAQVFLDIDNPARLLHQTTARPGIPTLTTTTLTVQKADLPMALMNVYKFYLKVGSLAVRGGLGWQISSIAVMGN